MQKIKIDTKKLRKITKTKNAFLSLCGSVIYQQISTSAGNSIYKKFLNLFKGKPTPEKFLKISEQNLREAGISPQKMSYLKDLAYKFQDKTINTKKISSMTDGEVKEHLIQVKGIGSWTADMFLIFALNRLDILPVGDLGIKKGFKKVFRLKNLPTEEKMYKLAEAYIGQRTNLSLYLWDSLDETIPEM